MIVSMLYKLAPYTFDLIVLWIGHGLWKLAQFAGIPNPPRFTFSALDVQIINIATRFTVLVTYGAYKVKSLLSIYSELRRDWRAMRQRRR